MFLLRTGSRGNKLNFLFLSILQNETELQLVSYEICFRFIQFVLFMNYILGLTELFLLFFKHNKKIFIFIFTVTVDGILLGCLIFLQ